MTQINQGMVKAPSSWSCYFQLPTSQVHQRKYCRHCCSLLHLDEDRLPKQLLVGCSKAPVTEATVSTKHRCQDCHQDKEVKTTSHHDHNISTLVYSCVTNTAPSYLQKWFPATNLHAVSARLFSLGCESQVLIRDTQKFTLGFVPFPMLH